MHNACDSLVSGHKITLDVLTCYSFRLSSGSSLKSCSQDGFSANYFITFLLQKYRKYTYSPNCEKEINLVKIRFPPLLEKSFSEKST